MSSYEEKVVDQGVDAAWRQFRLRLAEELLELAPGEGFSLTPEAAAVEETPYVRVGRTVHSVTVSLVADDHLEPTHRIGAAGRAHLRGLGFRLREGEPVLCVLSRLVDQAAHAAVVVLRDTWGVVHPSFVEVGRGLDLLGTAGQEPAVEAPVPVPVPEAVHLSGPDDLARWIDLVLEPEFGHAPVKRDDGDISVTGPGGASAVVSIRDDGRRVEVWTFLAEEVRFKATHRAIDTLSVRYPHFRFFLVRDDLVASISLPTEPLAPEQVVHALRRVLRLSGEELGLQQQLERRRRTRHRAKSVDHGLLSLFASIRTRDLDVVALALDLADGDPDRLAAWHDSALYNTYECRAIPYGSSEDSVRARKRQSDKWARTHRVLQRAMEQVSAESDSDERSAS